MELKQLNTNNISFFLGFCRRDNDIFQTQETKIKHFLCYNCRNSATHFYGKDSPPAQRLSQTQTERLGPTPISPAAPDFCCQTRLHHLQKRKRLRGWRPRHAPDVPEGPNWRRRVTPVESNTLAEGVCCECERSSHWMDQSIITALGPENNHSRPSHMAPCR